MSARVNTVWIRQITKNKLWAPVTANVTNNNNDKKNQTTVVLKLPVVEVRLAYSEILVTIESKPVLPT